MSAAQQRASLAVNREILQLYWQIGRDILDRQAQAGWGAGILDRLAADLRTAFPEMKGFSRTNLVYMRAFADAWPELDPIGQQPVGQLGEHGLSGDVADVYEAIVQRGFGAQGAESDPKPQMFNLGIASLEWDRFVQRKPLVRSSGSRHQIETRRKAIAHFEPCPTSSTFCLLHRDAIRDAQRTPALSEHLQKQISLFGD